MKSLMMLLFSLIMMSCSSFLPSKENAITENELYNHIKFLANDSLKGRKPGTDTGKLSAEYIRSEMLQAGLTPLGDNGFQYFDIVAGLEISEQSYFKIDGLDKTFGEEFTPIAFSQNGQFDGKVIFAGYGFDFTSDTLSWNSYENIDASNAWVIILRGSPDAEKYGNSASLRKKVMIAVDHGAKGVIFVSPVSFDEKDALIPADYAKREAPVYVPVFHITRDIANSLLPTKLSIKKIEETLNKTLSPNSFSIKQKINASANIIRNTKQTQNVIGIIEGSDPELKDEYIVIGGHYDHLGMGGPGSGSRKPDTSAVHNGADDNASGVAGALEIVERIASRTKPLKRSIIYIAFGAEEMGLIGSKYFVSNPLIDISKIKFMLNMDMIGRLKENQTGLIIGGTGTAVGLDKRVKKMASKATIGVKTSKGGYGPSDHASFYSKDISVLFFFTGVTEEYHTPADDIETLNIKGEKLVADLVYDIAVEMANKMELPAFTEAGPKSHNQTDRRKFKVTLGIIPDYAGESEVAGLRIDGVVSGKSAQIAGMEKGDIIIAMNGKSVKDIYEYMHRLSDFKVGQRISVAVMRGDEKIILIAEL